MIPGCLLSFYKRKTAATIHGLYPRFSFPALPLSHRKERLIQNALF